jgi:Mycothiol maleylpyruvate isomerase N-terminal domain
MDVERLLKEEDEAWQDLLRVFESVPADRFEEAGVTAEGWSPKDVMFHIGAWLAECSAVLDRITAGAGISDVDDDATDAKNATWFNMSRKTDVPTVRKGFATAREDACKRFADMSEHTAEAWSWFEESGPRHYAEHGDDLHSWLVRP